MTYTVDRFVVACRCSSVCVCVFGVCRVIAMGSGKRDTLSLCAYMSYTRQSKSVREDQLFRCSMCVCVAFFSSFSSLLVYRFFFSVSIYLFLSNDNNVFEWMYILVCRSRMNSAYTFYFINRKGMGWGGGRRQCG